MATKTLTLDLLLPDKTPAVGTRLSVSVDRDVSITGVGRIAKKGAVKDYTIGRDGAFPVISGITPNDDPALQEESAEYAFIIEAKQTNLGGITGGPWTVVITSATAATVRLSELPQAVPSPIPAAQLSPAQITQSIEDSAQAKSDAAQALATAQTSIAPTNDQIDAHLGGDASTVVPDVAARVIKDSQVINLADHVSGTGDLTAALNTFATTLHDGDELLIGKGTWRVDGTVTFPQNDLTFRIRQGAVIDRSNATAPTTASGMVFTGARVTVKGRGTITSKAVWDGTNTAWTEAVLKFTGDSPTVRDVTLTNIPRVGIGFKDCNGLARVTDVTITGNYPAGQWTEVETMHAGIAYDPGTTDARLNAQRNNIDSCVQAIFCGNYDLGSSSGSIAKDNILSRCWNHGIYNAGGLTGMVIAGNVFRDCSRPIAMTDGGHIVTGNTLTASGTGSTLYWTANISMRNATDCVVASNIIQGDLASTAAAIDFSHVSSGTTISGNQITGNRIKTTTANLGYAIRVGTAASTVMARNTVQGNIIESAGTVNNGLISMAAAASATDTSGNIVLGNTVTILSNSSGIYLSNLTRPKALSNVVRLGFDASSAAVLGGVRFAGTTGAVIRDTTVTVPPTFGTNVTMRAIWEESTGNTAPLIANSTISLDTTKLASGVSFVIFNAVIDESGTGAPAFTAGTGSKWTRTDGGAGSTLYVKESASNQNSWTAK